MNDRHSGTDFYMSFSVVFFNGGGLLESANLEGKRLMNARLFSRKFFVVLLILCFPLCTACCVRLKMLLRNPVEGMVVIEIPEGARRIMDMMLALAALLKQMTETFLKIKHGVEGAS